MKAVRPRAMARGRNDQRSMRRVVPKPRKAVPAGLLAGRALDAAALRDLVGRGHRTARRRRGRGHHRGAAVPFDQRAGQGSTDRLLMYRIVTAGPRPACGRGTARPRHGRRPRHAILQTPVKLHEYHAKTLLSRAGLPVPPYAVATTPAEARSQAAAYLDGGADAVVIKAQVLVGGRGKAGGVKLARSADEAEAVAAAILGMDIKGSTVRRVLVAPAADIVRELYLAAVLDRAAQRILLMGSAEGGVEIETLAEEHPEAIVRVHAHPAAGPAALPGAPDGLRAGPGRPPHAGRRPSARASWTSWSHEDADLVEINPLAIVREDRARRAGRAPGPARRQDHARRLRPRPPPRPRGHARPRRGGPGRRRGARAAGLSFIRLDGDIGCMVNGAGLAMTTMDLVKRAGGEPANFLDIGGGARADKVAEAMRLILVRRLREGHPGQHLRRHRARRRGRPRPRRGARPADPQRAAWWCASWAPTRTWRPDILREAGGDIVSARDAGRGRRAGRRRWPGRCAA